MAVTQHPMHALATFLPDGCFEPVVDYLNHYKVHLTITKKRKSVLGDYRHASQHRNHSITINGNLNKYEFLITLLHELAHLLTFEAFGNRVEPHGKEWKLFYSKLLVRFTEQQVFPEDIAKALQKSIHNPSATANGETELLMVLRKYNSVIRNGILLLAQIPEGAIFITENGRLFKKGPRRRKRYECVEVQSGLKYAFSAVCEVKLYKVE
ncbi:SprT-like domain-containing protein [Hydrotalea sp.]|uniref:SprT-like domain-containing protein n=1 Tax=Hydrotalea sp. TaxID=2881279 RepID=UPI00262B86B6|nr:SprT-like domain-containing protein [Hydrotalea sp.]